MTDDGEQRPSEPPEYNVYRSRRGLFSRLKSADLSSLRDRAKLPSWRRRKGEEPPRPAAPRVPFNVKRVLKWIALAALGWILLSLLAFAVSAQIQSFKLSGEAGGTLHGNPFLLPSAQTILVLGTDARPPDTKEPGAPHKQKCFEQQSHGDAPHDGCEAGEYRADTLMLIRAGGGTFRKLSIPRDTFAEIPGQAPQKINAAYAFGGAALQIETIEKFLGIQIDHVAIVDFTGFEDLIDAVGGVTVDLPQKLCADISGGSGGGQGGVTLHLKKGENTLDGEKALAYSRIREPSECPGPGKSAFTLGYNDLDREQAQQSVINGIRDRLTDPLRLPYNFIHGPIIGWDAPKAFVSDMGFFTMPQLILSAAIGGSSPADVLCGAEPTECGVGPSSSIEVPESVRRKAVHRLIKG
ncbi:MAG TPA: LCP family protein [Solirubrobacterales bacterium]|jgi:LCP family protein required for cell wall assembly|nr:LCP family protein [Solirubrobacterales bacterium]